MGKKHLQLQLLHAFLRNCSRRPPLAEPVTRVSNNTIAQSIWKRPAPNKGRLVLYQGLSGRPCQEFPSLQQRCIHSALVLGVANEAEESADCKRSTNSDGSSNVEDNAKVKRKKPKGKRAVVRWLKFFRWKKKKEYQRMTHEEKILYKLRKARKKEERLVEAHNKIVPKASSATTHDPEILTPEEHFFFLKMGLKCKNYVPVGRRGIYQGVILNMHLHWKKHQTLKVVVKTFTAEEVKEISTELARLSGGIVLDIHEDTIIMYRGKNYTQPPTEIMSPRVSLSRKKALDKSKYRDGLRAVRRYIPTLEQELLLLQHKNSGLHKTEAEAGMSMAVSDAIDSSVVPELHSKASDKLKKLLAEKDELSDEEDPLSDSMVASDSEALSDIFDTDSDLDTENGQPLYLNEFEKFPLESQPDQMFPMKNACTEETLREQPCGMFSDPTKVNWVGQRTKLPKFDEVDQIFLNAASLLKKKRR